MKVCLGPSSTSTEIWWCHTVRTQVGLEHSPYQARLLNQNIPSLWKAWICFVASNFSSEAAAELYILPLQALVVGTQEAPHGTHVALLGGLMDVLASGHAPNPLGAAGRGTAR